MSFESNQSSLSCAILLDTTGSMFRALPGVKNAVLRLIDEFRGENSAAIYSFNTSLQVLQDFTSDKSALKTAVLRTRAAGETALFDSISQAAMAIGKRGDEENFAVAIYSIAEGEAVTSPALSRGLKDISQVTGGVPYTVKKPKDVETVFQDISEDLQHGYMLTYKPPPAQDFGWRKIQLVVNGQKDYRLRAREGYLPE